MPIPALNSIAHQDSVLNSGRSSSRPKRIRPNRLIARNSRKKMKNVVAMR